MLGISIGKFEASGRKLDIIDALRLSAVFKPNFSHNKLFRKKMNSLVLDFIFFCHSHYIHRKRSCHTERC